MIDAHDITVALGGRPILHGADFAARAGAVTAIVGPNGSGKTTLLRALTGDVGHTGRLMLDDTPMAVIPGHRLARRRAVLPQATRLAFPFTVLEVVRLGLIAQIGPARETLPQRALAEVGLKGFAARFYHDLSGGEQQRVQLARVLVQVWEPVTDAGPSWLLLDEPVSSLDIGHQIDVMALVRRYADRGGGVVAVMHDLNLTAQFADSVAVMAEGRVVAQGAPAAVFDDARLSRVYGCRLRLNTVPDGPVPFVLPQTAGPVAAAGS
ncbi:heme ABC transporter ATP-binding protein [Meridianimarinicoccus sp. RP-17]|uniref:heme ABC transporter ATP-binding protein n=1 Tax=Meridianimarinicoccus zhengii TaxID=2056810 RepID=UPI000DAE9BFB|nr:heme ABC transporter ATP-binding protein [Phycocomes zhengii]